MLEHAVRIAWNGAALNMKSYLDPNEVELLEDAATNLRDRLLIRLLFYLGCRVSEALALRADEL